jgi:hypothetical protein
LQELTPLFRFEPIDSEMLARAAFPLAQSVSRSMSLKEWRSQLGRFRKGQGAGGPEQGHLAVISARGAVLAVYAFIVENAKDAICASDPNRRRMVITDIIGCRMPGFDPEAIVLQEKARIAASCRCGDVLRRH